MAFGATRAWAKGREHIHFAAHGCDTKLSHSSVTHFRNGKKPGIGGNIHADVPCGPPGDEEMVRKVLAVVCRVLVAAVIPGMALAQAGGALGNGISARATAIDGGFGGWTAGSDAGQSCRVDQLERTLARSERD